jgi:hypothetical protein
MLGCTDEEQLGWSTGQGRVIYSYNAADFCRLHSAYVSEGRNHRGTLLHQRPQLRPD